MNKGGIVGAGLGSAGGGGPTAAAAAAAAQKQKALLQRVDADIGNIVDNFSFLVNVARVILLPPPNLLLCFQRCLTLAELCRFNLGRI